MTNVNCNAKGEIVMVDGRACVVDTCPECDGVLRFDNRYDIVCEICGLVL